MSSFIGWRITEMTLRNQIHIKSNSNSMCILCSCKKKIIIVNFEKQR